MTRSGFHRQHTANAARSLLDGNRPQPEAVQLIAGKAAGEAKAFPVVVHHQDHFAFILPQFYHDVGSMRMFFHIV